MNLGCETEHIEFKESTSEKHEALESIASILNKHGYGEVYFGVKDNGDVKGQMIMDSTIKELTESIFRDIEPRIIPTITKENFAGLSVLKVAFSGTQVPYSAFGKFLIRVGTQNRKMSRDELVRLVKDSDYSLNWEKEISHSIDDIDDVTLKGFFQESVDCGRLSMKEYDKQSVLTTLGIAKGNSILNAAYALFGKNEPVALKLACFATDEKITFIDLKEIKGNIYNLITEAVNYIGRNIHWKIDIGQQKRIEVPEIPIMAIREIVINAFAHANYKNNPEIEINIHPGKITIFNPGSFPDELTPNDFINQNISSIKRNPLILSVLFRCKDVEQSGTGFKRMNHLCEEANVEWEFNNTAYGFYFSFKRRNVQANVQADVQPSLNKKDLSDNELTIYLKIRENRTIKNGELASIIGKSEKTVQRSLALLIKKGYLNRIGNNQYGYWEVLK